MVHHRNGHIEIYGYDLSTGNQFPICINGIYPSHPAISGDLVVWMDYRNDEYLEGNYDIYGAYIPEPATLCLLAVGGLAVMRRRCGRRHLL